MSEIRKPQENETLSQGIQQYLDPEQADAGTFRKFIANLAGNVGEYFGVNKTLDDIIAEAEANRNMNERYANDAMRRSGMHMQDKGELTKPIPDDSLPIFEKQYNLSMMPMGVAKGMNLESKYPEAFNEPMRKAYLKETRYQRGLMSDIGEKPRYKYDSPEQIYSTTQVADEPFSDMASSSPSNLDRYKKVSKIREYGAQSLGQDVGNKYPELRDRLRSGESPAIVTTRVTKDLPIQENNFDALADEPYYPNLDRNRYNDPAKLVEAQDIIDEYNYNMPQDEESWLEMMRAKEDLRNASEVRQHNRMMKQNRDYLSVPVPKNAIKK